MKQEPGIFLNGSLYVIGLVDGKPDAIRKGCVPTRIPPEKWERLKKACPRSMFACPACAEPVISFQHSQEVVAQTCKCTLVVHFKGADGPYRNKEQWAAFRLLHDQELQRPAPIDGGKVNPIDKSVKLNDKGREWMRQRLGLGKEIDFSDDGNSLICGDSSISFDPSAPGMLCGEDAATLALNVANMREVTGAGPDDVPGVIVMLGDDPDYVWPPGTILERVSSLPYKCHHCQTRVRRAPLALATAIDEAYCCLCACALFRRDTARPKSSSEWHQLRIRSQSAGVKYRSKRADGKS